MIKNKQLVFLFGMLVGFPVLFFVAVYVIFSGLALMENNNTNSGQRKPKPLPREGYEIIYPENGNGDRPDKDSFYYLSNKKQVIYRYDADRYLELQGENCNGLIWYHDNKNDVHTRIEQTFFTHYRLPKYPYFNPSRDYIGIPLDDLARIVFSVDGGRSFLSYGMVDNYAAVPSSYIERYIGVDSEPLSYSGKLVGEEKDVIISGSTGYFILNDGDILFGASHEYDEMKPWNPGAPAMFLRYRSHQMYYSLNKIFDKAEGYHLQGYGKYWPLFTENPPYLERITAARDIQVEPYEGWDRIRCEIGAEK